MRHQAATLPLTPMGESVKRSHLTLKMPELDQEICAIVALSKHIWKEMSEICSFKPKKFTNKEHAYASDPDVKEDRRLLNNLSRK